MVATSAHPHNIVNAMELVGYSFADMLPAYPGKDEVYLDQLLRDCALALSRPVLPYGLLGIYPCKSRYFNVSEAGFRSNGQPQPWPLGKGRTNIFFFGGSTAVGFNVEDSQTIPAKLQDSLQSTGMKCEVYNFGSGNYTTRHQALRFLDLIDQGFVPDCTIFLSGYNECWYAFGNQDLVLQLDRLYQQEKKRRRLSYLRSLLDFATNSYRDRRKQLPTSQSYATETMDKQVAAYLSETGIRNALQLSDRQLLANEVTDSHTRISKLVWEQYLDSVAIIRSLAKRKNVKTLFVWQPVPFYKTTKEQRVMERLYYVYRYGVFCSPVYNWLELNGFPSMQNAPGFLNLSGLGVSLHDALYVDICHYSTAFSEAIAGAISTMILQGEYYKGC